MQRNVLTDTQFFVLKDILFLVLQITQRVKPDQCRTPAWLPPDALRGYARFIMRLDNAVSGFWEDFYYKKLKTTRISLLECERDVVETMTSEIFDKTALSVVKALLEVAKEYEDACVLPLTECKDKLNKHIQRLIMVVASRITDRIMHKLDY
jgi:hypothetical protein